jgi:pimeloyl-ACP methyl ester carboxylesterase
MPCIDTGRVSLFFEDAGSGGVPVLLLHELGGSSESWREVSVCARGFLERRGHDLRR